MNFDKEYYYKIIREIMNIDSPSGYTNDISKKLVKEITSIGFEPIVNTNGSICVCVNGKSSHTIAFSAHADTLGLMVKSINSDGTLNFVKIGGINLATVDGEYYNYRIMHSL